jgi:hypothetical protein
MSSETSENMPSKQTATVDLTVCDSIDAQVQNKTLSKEEAYDQLYALVKGGISDLPSITKLWNSVSSEKDPSVMIKNIKLVLTKLVEVLQQHKKAVRIGHVFKEHFMAIWTQVLKELECHDVSFTLQQWIALNITNPILEVRDIRWILKDFEGYIIRSHLFVFRNVGLVYHSDTMSRDNYYILKKYIDDEENRIQGFDKWTIISSCKHGDPECFRTSLEKGAPFNVRDQPSNQTDELWVALKYGHLKVINFLREYEEKEGRPVVFTEEHAKYLRKLGHLETLRTLMPQFLTKEEKDGVSPPTHVPTLPEIPHDQFYEKISSGTQLRKINRELLFVDKPVDKKYFKYKNTADSVILFYNKDKNLAKIELELLELQKCVPQISFGKTTFDPPYYKSASINYIVAFFRNGCSLYHNSDNESSDFLYRQIQMVFYQTTIIPENEEFGRLNKKFENVKGDTTMSMADVKEYMRYTSIKSSPKELYENLTTSILPNDNTNADDYRTPFKYTLVTEEEMKTSEMSREDGDYERKQRAQEAAKSLRDPKKPSVFETKDISESESFMYERSIFSRLKERYGNGVDFVRDDTDNSPKYKGWFVNQPETNPFDSSNPFNIDISTLLTTSSEKDKNTPVKDIIDTNTNKKTTSEFSVADVDPESFNLQEAITKFYEEQKSNVVFAKETFSLDAYADKNTLDE